MHQWQSRKLIVLALGLGLSGISGAQSLPTQLPVRLTFASAPKQDTWNTVLIVSAAVMVVGLIQHESTLTLLGGAGVLVSLVQSHRSGFRPNYSLRGIDLITHRHLTLGISPFGSMDLDRSFSSLRPSLFIAANFRF